MMAELAGSTAMEVKSCCAALYETEWVRLVLGDSFHPGGLTLTERLGGLLGLDSSKTVLDVACGRGASALHLARTFGCYVIGVDFGAENVAAAQEAGLRAGLSSPLDFRVGDAEGLPLEDASVDAVICECAFCTFPAKAQAATEFVRVLRPGGRLGLSDLTRTGELPPELEGLLAWAACIAGARPVDEYVAYLTAAGFVNPTVEPHDEALLDLVKSIRQKLLGAELLVKLGALKLSGVHFEQAKIMAKSAAEAIRDGQLGYTLLIASKMDPLSV